MATQEQCRQALEGLVARLGRTPPEQRRGQTFDRTISCRVPDLGLVFSGELKDGLIDGFTTESRPRAQIRLTADSDELVALTDGRVSFSAAWIAGRLRVEASIMDLMKLRSML